jgi:Mor family transcriptional regulator
MKISKFQQAKKEKKKKEAIFFYKKGASSREVAKKIKMSHTWVWNVVKCL